jgi:hypothetical protein
MPVVIAVVILLCAWPAHAEDLPVAAETRVGDRMVTENVMAEGRFWALIAGTTAYEADPEGQLDAGSSTSSGGSSRRDVRSSTPRSPIPTR